MNENEKELSLIKRLCILNFLEMQEIKRKLKLGQDSTQEFYDYQNSVHDYLKELDSKMASLLRDFPHLEK